MKHLNLAALVAAGALSACATPTTLAPAVDSTAAADEAQRQVEYAVEARVNEAARVTRVAARLFRANEDLCPYKRPKIEAQFGTVYDFAPQTRAAAARILGLSDTARVIALIPDGPAAKAGLKEGDEILAVNNVAIPTGAKATGRLGIELTRAAEKSPDALSLKIRRGVETSSIEIAPKALCGYDVHYLESAEINAYADGDAIYVTRGILKMAATDDELALVIAHELAHNTQKHMQAKQQNARIAGLGGLVLDVAAAAGGVNTDAAFTKMAARAGAGYASAEFEAEADYVGMYFLARAGYQTDGVENFWRKMAVESPDSIFIKSSHPANPERYLALRAANTEIRAKQAAGAPLVPNSKPTEGKK